MPEPRQRISVRIVRVSAPRCFDQILQVAAGARVCDAIKASRLLQQLPEAAMTQLRCGIFGRQVDLDCTLHDGDRIEILQPLRQSPAAARRARAKLAGKPARR